MCCLIIEQCVSSFRCGYTVKAMTEMTMVVLERCGFYHPASCRQRSDDMMMIILSSNIWNIYNYLCLIMVLIGTFLLLYKQIIFGNLVLSSEPITFVNHCQSFACLYCRTAAMNLLTHTHAVWLTALHPPGDSADGFLIASEGSIRLQLWLNWKI